MVHIFPLFLLKNISCDPLLEPSHHNSPNEGSQCMFLLRNKKKYLPSYPESPTSSRALSHCYFMRISTVCHCEGNNGIFRTVKSACDVHPL